MTENKRALGSHLTKVDAHMITLEEYNEIPELTDEFFERAVRHQGDRLVKRGHDDRNGTIQSDRLRCSWTAISSTNSEHPAPVGDPGERHLGAHINATS